jgi:hypothetical protein
MRIISVRGRARRSNSNGRIIMKCRNCNAEYGSEACLTCGEHKANHHHKPGNSTEMNPDAKAIRLSSKRLMYSDRNYPQGSSQQ